MSTAARPEQDRSRTSHQSARAHGLAVVGLSHRSETAADPESLWRSILGLAPASDAGRGPVSSATTDPFDVARSALDDVVGSGTPPLAGRSFAVVLSGEAADSASPVPVATALAFLEALHPEWSAEDLEAVSEEVFGRSQTTAPRRGGKLTAARLAERLGLDTTACMDLSSATASVAIRRAGAQLARGLADVALVVAVDGGDRDAAASGRATTAVVLKRLDAAERDGDRIYAVLPRRGRADRGGAAGDRREERTATAYALPAPSIDGSNALLAGCLALHHRLIPPGEGTPDRPRPWVHGGTSRRRVRVRASGEGRAIVLEEHGPSADAARPGWMTTWDTEAILLGASSRDAWIELAEALLSWLDVSSNARVRLKDLAATLNCGQPPAAFRVGMVVGGIDDLRDRLRATIRRLGGGGPATIQDARGTYAFDAPLAGPGRLVFLYAGEGSQYPGMLADLCPHFPELRRALDTADRLVLARGRTRLPSDVLFDGAGGADAGTAGAAVSVVLSTQWALHQLLGGLGLSPDVVVGHSSGEILALAASGALRADRVLEERLGDLCEVFERLEESGGVPEATLVSVAADRARVTALLREAGLGDRAAVALDNCPHQVVVAGPAELAGFFKARGLLAEELPFRRAYHTPQFAAALGPVRAFFERLDIETPRIPVYSCATAAAMPAAPGAIRAIALDQWVRPVEFRATIESIYESGGRIFVEVGARGSLTGYVDDILRGRPHLAVAANLPRRPGLTQLNHLVAALYAQGVPVRPDLLYARRRPAAIDLSRDLPSQAPGVRDDVDHAAVRPFESLARRLRAKSGRVGEGAPRSALEPPRDATPSTPATGAGEARVVPAAGRSTVPQSVATDEATLLDFQETMRLFLQAQHDVMAAYLGSGPPVAATDGYASPDRDEPAAPPFDRGEAVPATVEARVGAGDAEDVLLGLVSRRTGYPRSMLDLGHDLEADLGIDSIKRVEILGELRDLGFVGDDQDVEGLSRAKTLREVLDRVRAGRGGASEPAGWTGAVVSHVPGHSFVGRWPLEPDDPVALQHTLGGRRLSEIDPGRLGLPVLPFTVMAEILAQGAAVLVPGRVVVALRDVRANRWVPFDPSGTAWLDVAATRDPSRPDEVRVALRTTTGREGPTGDVAFEGVVAFGARRPDPTPAAPFTLGDASPCRIDAEGLYREQWLFHGPQLRALTRVGEASGKGIEGTLTVLPRRALLPESRWPVLHTDPIVLDAFTHLLGGWGIDKRAGEEGDVMFPLRVREIAFQGEDPPEGTQVECRIAVEEVTRPFVRVRADLVAPGGIWATIEGWEDWRFYWPGRYRDVFRSPATVLVGEPLHLGEAGVGVWLEPPADMGKPIWREVLEWVQLSPEERAALRAEGPPDRERTLRIWSAVAAKEAARRLWLAAGHPPIFPGDVAIETSSEGLSSVVDLRGRLPEPSPIAWACSGVFVVAAAGGHRSSRPGVAVEPLAGADRVGLDGGARALVDRLPEPTRDEWAARLRCARLAASRALGEARDDASSPLEVQAIEPESGLIRLRSHAGGREIVAGTGRRGEHAWAICIRDGGQP